MENTTPSRKMNSFEEKEEETSSKRPSSLAKKVHGLHVGLLGLASKKALSPEQVRKYYGFKLNISKPITWNARF